MGSSHILRRRLYVNIYIYSFFSLFRFSTQITLNTLTLFCNISQRHDQIYCRRYKYNYQDLPSDVNKWMNTLLMQSSPGRKRQVLSRRRVNMITINRLRLINLYLPSSREWKTSFTKSTKQIGVRRT